MSGTRLQIGDPGRSTKTVSGMASRLPLVQRKCVCGQSAGMMTDCAECAHKKPLAQRRVIDRQGEPAVPSIVHEVLSSPGRPLDAGTRAFMESRFGDDFSDVRIHADAKADESAQAIDALAYTVGREIVFGAHRYRPGSEEGDRLLAHELAHTIQQRGLGKPSGTGLKLGPTGDAHEQEADRMAEAVSRSGVRRVSAFGAVGSLRDGAASHLHRINSPFSIQRQVPTGITLKESKPFGHGDLKNDEDKKTYRTYIGAATLLQLTPPGDYTAGQKKGECTKEFLTEVSNTCPAHEFCTGNKCLQVGQFGTSGDARTGMMVTDGPDTFSDLHRTQMPTSFLEGSGKDKCSVVCHQRYAYRTEPDRKYHDLGSFYIIRNFRAGKHAPTGSKDALHITTGEVKKVAADLKAPTKETFAKDVAPGLVKSGALLEAPPVPKDEKK